MYRDVWREMYAEGKEGDLGIFPVSDSIPLEVQLLSI